MIISQWHVPIDDTHCWWYAMFTSYGEALDKKAMRDQRLRLYTLPDYRPRLNKANDYGFDASEQERLTFTGMGEDINVHDQWAVESPGPIHDRTTEHLGDLRPGDHPLPQAVESARSRLSPAAPGRPCRPTDRTIFHLPSIPSRPREEWSETWRRYDADRRARSGWAAP